MHRTELQNPVADRALKRRAQWEAERRDRIWQMVEAGHLTEEQARERLED